MVKDYHQTYYFFIGIKHTNSSSKTLDDVKAMTIAIWWASLNAHNDFIFGGKRIIPQNTIYHAMDICRFEVPLDGDTKIMVINQIDESKNIQNVLD